MTLPAKTRPYTDKWDYYASKGYTEEQFDELSAVEKHNLFAEWRDLSDKEQRVQVNNFRSSHFEEPNIAVHLRMNTRTDADGKKVLFLEEVQSDYGQTGREKGFRDEKAIQQARDDIKKADDEFQALYNDPNISYLGFMGI